MDELLREKKVQEEKQVNKKKQTWEKELVVV